MVNMAMPAKNQYDSIIIVSMLADSKSQSF